MEPIQAILLAAAITLIAVLLVSGAPIFVAFGAGAVIVIFAIMHQPPQQLAGQAFAAVNKYSLLAIPFFILSGNLMVEGKSAKSLVDLVMSLMGHLRGGLAIAVIAACAYFAAISGSGMATAVAIGAFLVPEMTARGYPLNFSSAIVAAGGMLGVLIPPSVTFIVLADVTGASTGKLFAAGMVPGIFTALLMAATVWVQARRKNVTVSNRQGWRQRAKHFKNAGPCLVMPVIVLGSIYGGIATPTEAALIACVYAAIIGFFPYRGLFRPGALMKALADALRATASIWFIIAGAVLIGTMLTFMKVPQALSTLILDQANLSPLMFTVLVASVFVVFGMFFEAVVIHYVILPMLLGVVAALNIDLIPFCVMLTLNTMVGNMTPPVAVQLYGTCSVTGADPVAVTKEAMPLLGTMVAAMFVVIFWTDLSTWLPRVLGL